MALRTMTRIPLRGISALLAAFVAIGITCFSAGAQTRVIGYYPMWLKSTLPANKVRFDYVTHVNHAFAWPNTDGTIASDDGASVDTAIINTAHRAGRKILLSFGGAGTTQTANFALVAADTALRRKFIANVVARLSAWHYDGADIDWEGPANATDRSNETALISQLRAALRKADSTWLLTMAVGVSDWSGQWEDYASLKLSVDWFNAMCYDIFGSWSPYAGHNAPMVEPPAHTGDWSVTQGITYLHVTRGIPGSQLTLGLPFFGQRFHFTLPGGLYQSFTSAGEVTYTDVRTDMALGWIYAWDTLSQVPYLKDPTGLTLDSFDDSLSIAIKCAYAQTAGLSGVMIWALGEDLWGGAQPLMSAVGKGISPSTGVSPQPGPPLAEGYRLYDNYPNPFNPSTTVRYTIPRRSEVSLVVYNAIGQEVAQLVSGVQDAGVHEARFESGSYASGVYICRIRSGEFAASKVMVLLR
jgi:chitinase